MEDLLKMMDIAGMIPGEVLRAAQPGETIECELREFVTFVKADTENVYLKRMFTRPVDWRIRPKEES